MDPNNPPVPDIDDGSVPDETDAQPINDVPNPADDENATTATADVIAGLAANPTTTDLSAIQPIPSVQPVEQSAPPSVPPSAPLPAPAFDPHSPEEISFLRTVLAPRAWASHRARTQAKLERIMVLAHEKGQIDRGDVRDLLNRSKPACTRYLTTLVRQGRLTRHRVLDDTVYKVVE